MTILLCLQCLPRVSRAPDLISKHALRVPLIQLLIVLTFVASGCHLASTTTDKPTIAYSTEARQRKPPLDSRPKSEAYGAPVHLADLADPAISESSGLAASRLNPDLFWTHNDSGDGPFLYAFDRRGNSRGVWRVTGAEARDWEDMAIGLGPQPGRSYLYVGDIGDNGRARSMITVYRVPEPSIKSTDTTSTKINPRQTETAEAIRLKYPDGKHDAEALMIHPTSGDLYIVTKTANSFSNVYKVTAPLSISSINTLIHVGEVRVGSVFGGMITGGDISPDGRRVVLCDYLSAYEMRLPEGSNNKFDGVWKQSSLKIELGPRQQGEAVCYRLDGKALLATSEKRPTPLIEVKRIEN